MSARPAIPHSYAVVQLDDKQWYPLRIRRYYSAENPEGAIMLDTLVHFNQDNEVRDACYPHREEAVQYVQHTACSDEDEQRVKWRQHTIKSDVYPEQCVHSLEMIEEITGHTPTVRRWSREVNVFIDAYTCSCGKLHSSYWDFSQVTIEDALQRAAEYVYEHRCLCTATSAHEYEQRVAA